MKEEVGTKKRKWVLFVVLFVGGITVAVCSVVFMPIIYDAIIDTVVRNMMVLNPSSAIFPDWKEPPLPLYSRFYIFHVENPNAVLEGAKPVVAEKGPYVYRVEVPRQNVTFNDNGTITSAIFYTYYYERTLSVGPETDVYTMVNPVAVSTTILAKRLSPFGRKQLSRSMEALNETVFMNRSVGEILWGYEDGFIALVDKYFTIPGWDSDQFGVLWGRNNSDLGFYTMYDGTQNQSMLNQFDRFNGRPELDWWYSPEANMLNGTDGTMYHPYIDRGEMLELFHPDICRSIPFHYEKDITFNGVPLYKFVLANYTYANGTVHPPNAGFYKEDTWAPSGILRQDPCRFGQPMGLSNPHFLDGDPVLYESVEGLNPTKENHESILAIEQKMGLPYIFNLKLQINSLMEPVEHIRQVENVPRLYFPLMWFEQSVEADDYIISMYKKGFVTTEKVMDSMQWIFFSVGIILSIMAAYYFTRWYQRSRHAKEEVKDSVTGNELFIEIEDEEKIISGNEENACVKEEIFKEEENEMALGEEKMATEMDGKKRTENDSELLTEQDISISPVGKGEAIENVDEMIVENKRNNEKERTEKWEDNVAYEEE